MFSQLSQRLQDAVKSLRGQSELTEKNMAEVLQDIRYSLIDADVALEVVDALLQRVKQGAIGTKILSQLNPAQTLTKLIHDNLVELMGQACESLDLNTQPPAVILLAGLQGAGKTTTAAKLAHHLTHRQKKRVLLTSTDIYRPGAIQQLQTLADQCHIAHYQADSQKPVVMAQQALAHAKQQLYDVLIIDSAGRLHIDQDMMQEISAIHQATSPHETLFVVDSMTGQDAANAAKSFDQTLPLTGTILTKIDGDTRGGAALSVRFITNKPIKFLGEGEKIEALEPFHPDRIASRILGMGDVLTLVEEAERKVDREASERLAKKIRHKQAFDFNDFRSQLTQMKQMGGMGQILAKLPGMGQLPPALKSSLDDRVFQQMSVMIDSMTAHERAMPKIINGSRKKRIAQGSGTSVPAVNKLLKQHTQMQKMMKKMGGMKNPMKLMQQLKGKLPPGMI